MKDGDIPGHGNPIMKVNLKLQKFEQSKKLSEDP